MFSSACSPAAAGQDSPTAFSRTADSAEAAAPPNKLRTGCRDETDSSNGFGIRPRAPGRLNRNAEKTELVSPPIDYKTSYTIHGAGITPPRTADKKSPERAFRYLKNNPRMQKIPPHKDGIIPETVCAGAVPKAEPAANTVSGMMPYRGYNTYSGKWRPDDTEVRLFWLILSSGHEEQKTAWNGCSNGSF